MGPKRLALGVFAGVALLAHAAGAQTVDASGAAAANGAAPANGAPPAGGATVQADVRIGMPVEQPPPGAPVAQPPVVYAPRPAAPPPVTYAGPPQYDQPYLNYGYYNRAYPYQGGQVPAGAHLEQRPITGLIAAGASIFGALYVTSALAGIELIGASPEVPWMLVPVIGPAIFVAASPGAGSAAGAAAILVLDSVFQAGGVAMFIAGFAVHRQMVVFGPRTAAASRAPRWSFVPAAPGAPVGASLSLVTF